MKKISTQLLSFLSIFKLESVLCRLAYPSLSGTKLIFMRNYLWYILLSLGELIPYEMNCVTKSWSITELISDFLIGPGEMRTCPSKSKFEFILNSAGGKPLLFGVAEKVGWNPETAQGLLAIRGKRAYVKLKPTGRTKLSWGKFRCCSKSSWI